MFGVVAKLTVTIFAIGLSCGLLAREVFAEEQNAKLNVSGIFPTSGSTTGGTAVTVTGAGFEKGTDISFGYVPAQVGYQRATGVEVVDETKITAITPAHTQGTVDVIVTKRNGETAALVRGFEYK